jgi:hypothetical protein
MPTLFALSDDEIQLIKALRLATVAVEAVANALVATEALVPQSRASFNAVRYFRPKHDNGEVIGNRGITAVFTVYPTDKQFTVRYSICNGDVFSKDAGRSRTMYNQRLSTFPYDASETLGTNFRNNLEAGLHAGAFAGRLREDVKHILHQMYCSGM